MGAPGKTGVHGVEKLSQIKTFAVVRPGMTGVGPVQAVGSILAIPQTTRFFASFSASVFC
jgi:hypothetical protein